MSSLRSMILKGAFFVACKGTSYEETYIRVAKSSRRAFSLPQMVLVRAQSVLDDLVPEELPRSYTGENDPKLDWFKRLTDWQNIPKPKPPYQLMWLEAIFHGLGWRQRTGAFVERFEGRAAIEHYLIASGSAPEHNAEILGDDPQTVMHMRFLHEHPRTASVEIAGYAIVWLDKDGSVQGCGFSPAIPIEQLQDLDEVQMDTFHALLQWRAGWVLHSFARMNCHNVTLVPIEEGGRNHKHRGAHEPSTVWHTIKVSAAPTMQRRPSSEREDDSERRIRLHWIRGHYADYTKGRGLFGNPNLRKVFWVSEHQAGSEEVGEVVSAYVVQ